jgi:uncharacterized membrane protein
MSASLFGRIGFSAQAITLLLLAALLGSVINIPLFTLESHEPVMADTFVTVFGMTYRVHTARGLAKYQSYIFIAYTQRK